MKVLAVIIGHPLRKFGGAMKAGNQLSAAISKLQPYSMAVMWDIDEIFRVNELTTIRVASTNPFSAFSRWLPRWVYIPLYTSSIPRLIMEEDFDLVHIHNPIPALAMKGVAKACLRKKVPYCISAHGFMELTNYSSINKVGFIKKFLVKIAITGPFSYVVKHASWIFTLSPSDEDYLRKLAFPVKRSSCITNGVDPYYLESPARSDITHIREKLDLRECNLPILLFAGSLHLYKGIDTFIKSLRHIDIPLVAIVAGKLKSDAEKEAFLKLNNASGVGKHRLVFTGWLTDEELRALLNIADVYSYPTRADTLPLCILEAMASGLAIVSTRVAGVPFQLADGAGIVIEPDNELELAAKVTLLLEDAALRTKMGKAACDRVKAMFIWEKSASAAVEGYRRIENVNSKDALKS